MNGAPRLTVAMIVRNESKTICRSLDSIQGIADQVVVFDSSDDDSTCEAAQGYDTEWIDAEWPDDFAAARNACLSHADGDWVLWLDSGETMSAADADSLREFVDTQADPNKLYMLLVATESTGPNDEGEQIGCLRLAPNREGLTFNGRVRESLEESAIGLGMSLEGLPHKILRGADDRDKDRKTIRANRNLQLVDIETAAHGPSAKMHSCAGAAYQDLGRFDDAARAYAKAIDAASPGSMVCLESYYGLLSTLDNIPDSGDQQVQFCLKALEMFPVDTQLLCAMGGYLQRQQRLDLATRSYETAFRFGRVNPLVWHVTRIHEIAAVCLGLALQLQGEDDAALDVLKEAVERHPESSDLKRHLLNGFIRQAMRDEALDLLDQMAVEQDDVLRSVVRGACLAVEENWLAANAYLKLAFQSGCRDPLGLRWFAIALLRQGLGDEANEVLDAWEQAEPGNGELASYREMAQAAKTSAVSNSTKT